MSATRRVSWPIAMLMAAGVLAGVTSSSYAMDPENCLSCHRFRGLSRIDPETEEIRLFFCSASYYAEQQGPHARLQCSDCHERSEVEVVPHDVKTPVNCTRQCHIVPLAGVEIPFSHQNVQDALTGSAHDPAMLSDLPFESPLLREGQSECLFCHDQPVYRDPLGRLVGLRWAHGHTRCDTCHAEGWPVQVPYHIRHVTSRLQSARPIRQLAQVCAVCHSDPAVLEATDSHDAVASYLHSFHGKASLLGSTETANCVDCHASERGDFHAVPMKDDPTSSVNEERVAMTCRTTQCHPGAAPGLSQAAVHLELNPAARTPEFYVAAMFILLTASVMLVFFVFIMLELINSAVRRHDPEVERLVLLAEELKDSREGRRLVQRMTVAQRLQHWALAITFILLVATGMPIKFADQAWASTLLDYLGGLHIARLMHRVCAVLLVAAFVYHLFYFAGEFINKIRKARRAGSRESILSMFMKEPMVLTPTDFINFGKLFMYLLGLRRHRPSFGQFNFMQKFEYWAVFWGTPIMGVSGFILWMAADFPGEVSGRWLNFGYIIHSDESFLAFIYIAVVHIFSIILTPAVFPLSPATITGQAPSEELAEGHRGFLEDAAKRLNITVEVPPKPAWSFMSFIKQLVRRVYAAGMCVVCAFLCFTSLRFLLLLLFGHQSAPANIVDIPKRLDMPTLVAAANQRIDDPDASVERRRGPLAHFHQVPTWFQSADRQNSCTTSGCHTPLPHGDRIEVRAFLNMHATFTDCSVCHSHTADRKLEANWFGLPEREVQQPPALLRLVQYLEDRPVISDAEAAEVSDKVHVLLHAIEEEAGPDLQLQHWRLRLETTHPESELWQQLMSEIRGGLIYHTHGEYDAKIGLYENNAMIGGLTEPQIDAAKRYLEGKDSLAEEKQQALLDTVHENVAPAGAMCTPCHVTEPDLIDFKKLGYPDSRLEELVGSPIVQQIIRIEQGQPFRLPRMLGGTDGR